MHISFPAQRSALPLAAAFSLIEEETVELPVVIMMSPGLKYQAAGDKTLWIFYRLIPISKAACAKKGPAPEQRAAANRYAGTHHEQRR